MMKKFFRIVAVLLICGCAAKPYTGETISTKTDASGLTIAKSETRTMLPGKVLAGSESELRQVVADVVKTDPATRRIFLRTTDGKVHPIVAGPAVRNFAQIKPGDRAKIDYFAAVTFEVRAPSREEFERAQSTAAVFGRAPIGGQPAGVVGVGDVAILVIDKIDKAAQTVTLKGPNGSFSVKSNHPENLDHIRRGESVVVEVAQVLAASVATQSL